jgi:molecular chaperone GrpE
MNDNHKDDNHKYDSHKKKHTKHEGSPDASADHQATHQATELQQQIGELTEALQRERADALNMRRRHEEDMAGLKTRVRANVIRELLPVIDNFERALKHVPEDLKNNDYIKGVQGVVKQFEKTLADIGVERIKTTDEPFDPRLHEAVSMEEGEGTDEVVSEELQAGYRIGEDVIRHAMVRVTTR